MPYPEVKFAVRYPAGQGAWRYETVDIPHPGGAFMPLEHLPAAGDLVTLWDRGGSIPGGPHFRVLQRAWTWSGYGSANWPYGKDAPQSGPRGGSSRCRRITGRSSRVILSSACRAAAVVSSPRIRE